MILRRCAVYASCVVLGWSSAAVAQSSNSSVGSAVYETASRAFQSSCTATSNGSAYRCWFPDGSYQEYDQDGLDTDYPSCSAESITGFGKLKCAAKAAASDVINDLKNGVAKRWDQLSALLDDFLANPLKGDYGGGGSTGTDWCTNFNPHSDADGRVVVPSIPLAGGGGIVKGTGKPAYAATFYMPNLTNSNNEAIYSSNQTGPALRAFHLRNTQTGDSDHRRWTGVYKISGSPGATSTTSFYGASQSYYNAQGQKVGIRYDTFHVGHTPNYNFNSCPEDASGGDADFYKHQNTGAGHLNGPCVGYLKNDALGVGGYAYPESVAIPVSEVNNYVYSIKTWRSVSGSNSCVLTPEAIKKGAQAIIDRACAAGNLPCVTVDDDDVVTGGEEPGPGDIYEEAEIEDGVPTRPGGEDPGDPPPPDTGPFDPDAPDAGESWADPGIDLPTLDTPSIDFPDWFELPEFSWGAPTCPVWSADFFGETVTLDQHCPLIDQNAALISALMIVAFSIGSAIIVLRA